MSKIFNKDNIKSEHNKEITISVNEIDKNNIDKNETYLKKFIKQSKRGITPNEKSTNIEATTTERKPIEVVKETDNNESNNTSVDIKTDYADEKINIKNTYSFNIHNITLNYLFNSGVTNSNSKEVFHEKNSKDITPREEEKEQKKSEKNNNKEDKKSFISFEDKISKKSNNITTPIKIQNNIETPIKIENDIINENEKNDYITNSNYDDFSFNYNFFSGYKAIYFKEIMLFKNIEFERDYELNIKKNDIFHTIIRYKNKECILLLRNEFLYILEKKTLKEKDLNEHINNDSNPDLSLINHLQKDEDVKEKDKNILKKKYEISHPLVCLNFNLLSCKLLLNKKSINNKDNKFEMKILILGTSTKYSIFFQNFDIYKKFIYLIGSKIKTSDGYKTNKIGLSLRTKDFYKDTYISTSYFESIAKTGDLLLFRTLDCLSDCQRFFTRDQYDHIALIIKRNGVIELLETTSNENCNLLEWRSFKYRLYNLVFKKIALRKLNIDEEDLNKKREIEENIEIKTNEFIDKVIKKKYIMSILKMIFDGKPKEYEITGDWEQAEGYCCSALTAAYYIYNGVMQLQKSVHCVRPGDFEQDRNRIIILPGYSFGTEKIIEFST